MKETKSIVVIGGGIAGITSALELANNGYDVHLIEKEDSLGGQAVEFCCKATEACTKCSACLVPQKVAEVSDHPRVSVMANSTVTAVTGETGDFQVEVARNAQHMSPQETETLKASAVIAATGFKAFNAKELGCLSYGRYPNIVSGLDLEKMFRTEGELKLPTNNRKAKKIAFIQCVGSRDEKHNYCSHVCCKYAIRLANLINYNDPEAEVTIFYIDLQTAGKGFTPSYEESKESVRFVRGVPVEILETADKQLEVRFENIVNGKVEREIFDLVTLSVGISPRDDSWDVAQTLGISLADNGFLATKAKFNSTDTNVDGVFLAGACQSPKDIPDSIAHGISAAERAMEVLQRCA